MNRERLGQIDTRWRVLFAGLTFLAGTIGIRAVFEKFSAQHEFQDTRTLYTLAEKLPQFFSPAPAEWRIDSAVREINTQLGIAILTLMESPHPKLQEAGNTIPTLGWKLNLYFTENAFNGQTFDPPLPRPLWGGVQFPTEESWEYSLTTNENLISSRSPEALGLHLFASYRQWQLLEREAENARAQGISFGDYLSMDGKDIFALTEAQAWRETIEKVIIYDNKTGLLTKGLKLDKFIQELLTLYSYCGKQEDPQGCWVKGFEAVARPPAPRPIV